LRRKEGHLQESEKLAAFESMVLPHVGAAYNLARWLTRNDSDAEDVTQEAFLRAFKYFQGFQGMNGRVWLMKIVRNTCYSWLKKNRNYEIAAPFNEEINVYQTDNLNPEELLLKSDNHQLLKQGFEELPVEFREVAILSELEGLSYKEIAEVLDISLGTVMSRLARARKRLKQYLANHLKKEF
jgi:RNA polymerase sigma-70 factor, ECF subfamily